MSVETKTINYDLMEFTNFNKKYFEYSILFILFDSSEYLRTA